ncbi:MAG: hypothetical protein LBJ36_05420 [Synergistaceae bacterium]|jgi:hypothetical protein|nr:hypothetical protein [Synergistaceae bacterium]
MWKKIVSMAMDLVAQIEYELKGKTGPEKKKLVIELLVKAIDIPFVPDSLETPIERVVYGYLIDQVCGWLNTLSDRKFANLELTDAQKEEIVAMIELKPEELISPELLKGESVDDKLDALYTKYKVQG